jgi:hypothetical protein
MKMKLLYNLCRGDGFWMVNDGTWQGGYKGGGNIGKGIRMLKCKLILGC